MSHSHHDNLVLQMKAAPQYALFICRDKPAAKEAVALSQKINRTDLSIRSISCLSEDAIRGYRQGKEMVIAHDILIGQAFKAQLYRLSEKFNITQFKDLKAVA